MKGEERERKGQVRTAAATAPETALAVKAYENACGVLPGGTVREEMLQAIDDLAQLGHPEWWQQALDEAVAHNARSWAYVKVVIETALTKKRAPGSKPIRRNGSKPDVPETYEERRARYVPAGYEDLIES